MPPTRVGELGREKCELLAAFLALQCFAKQQHNTTILLKMDNVTAVTYINKMGGTQSEGLCHLALTIWNWCLQQNIFLIAEYLPGEENTVADEESRNMKDRCDWMLNPRIFRQVQDGGHPIRGTLPSSPDHREENTVADEAVGAIGNRPVCVSSDETVTTILQLEAGSGGREHGCIQPGLVQSERLHKPSMVLDSSLAQPDKATDGQSGHDHTALDHATMVSNDPGDARELSTPSPSNPRPGNSANGSGRLYNEARGTGTSCMAYLRESFTSRGISTEASNLLLSSWRTKTKSNYNSLFSKWVDWCQPRDRNPTTGPIEDVINFLAYLHKEGYQYRSLNSYRSAISAVHAEVDGYPVGQHPLVTRMLKGAFNERPPLPKYSSFWDVGLVLRYLKKLGNNETLSLRLTSIKSATLLALTRPSRSVDLSKLDIQARSYTASGVTFKAQHLSKQSRPSKPLADFFYPRFPEDPLLCPVVTLQAYESKTLEFRDLKSDNPKTTLFLSWIGKHDPVTSSTIARWLRTCLQEAGINTEVFKPHSIRGAASSKAAWSGVTISDILQAADWSSEATFQKFYHRMPEDSSKSSFGKAVLSSAASNLHSSFGKAVLSSAASNLHSSFGKAVLSSAASNLHVDIETEPSEM